MHQNRVLPYLPALFVGVGLFIFGIYADALNQNSQQHVINSTVQNKVGILRAQLEGRIISNALLVQGLVASIASEPNMSQQQYAELASHLFGPHSELRNIGAAPGLVIRYMYPFTGNEAAIGLDYNKHPDQLKAVMHAKQTGNLVLAGPVNLVQGGQGFIARIPVFLDPIHHGKDKFWGMISAVIDVNKLYKASGLLDENLGLEIAIRGKDGDGEAGDIFYGRKEIFSQSPALTSITLPHGSWQLAAIPDGGWDSAYPQQAGFRFLLVVIGLLIVTPIVILGRYYLKNHENVTRLQGLFELSPIGIALNDLKSGTFIEANESLIKPTGYSKEEFFGLSFWDLTPPEYKEEESKQLEKLKKTGRYGPYTKEYIRKDGSRYPVLLNGMLIDDAGGTTKIWSIVEDLSEREKTEAELTYSKEQLELVISSAEVGIWDWKVQSGEVRFNERWAEIIGYSLDELKPSDINTWTKYAHADDLVKSNELLEAHWQGKTDRYICEARMKHRDGHWVWVLDTGRTVEWDRDGKPARMIGTHLDITDRKNTEELLISARDAAEQSNRAKSDFLSRMSHELRTPMNAILGFTQLLEMENLKSSQQDSVREIRNAGFHLLELINEVLDLAKVESGQIEMTLEKVNVEKVTNECLILLNTAAKNNDIQFEYKGPDDIDVKADRLRLKQVLLNLLSNAVKYNREGGLVTLEHEVMDDNYLRIKVTDTGHGIPEKHLNQIWEPFQRLSAEKTSIEGTGIGLTLTRQITEQMGGRIGAESEIGVGSIFWLELPIAQVDFIRQKEPGG